MGLQFELVGHWQTPHDLMCEAICACLRLRACMCRCVCCVLCVLCAMCAMCAVCALCVCAVMMRCEALAYAPCVMICARHGVCTLRDAHGGDAREIERRPE